MKRFLNSVLCMCIAVFCTHAQKKNVTSVLEVMDITTGQRSVVKEFPFLIEAPNWTPDGNWLVYNSGGKLYKLSPESPGEPQLINSDYATRCNNDHVISADGKQIAISNGTKEDGRSRIYTLPFEGGVPRLITPLGPSYLHGWSPDGKQLAYCAERNGNFDVYVIPALGGEEKTSYDSRRFGRWPRILTLRTIYLVQLRTYRAYASLAHEGGWFRTNPDDIR